MSSSDGKDFKISLSLTDFTKSVLYAAEDHNEAFKRVTDCLARDPVCQSPLAKVPLPAIYNLISNEHSQKQAPMMQKLARYLKHMCMHALNALGVSQQGSQVALTGFSSLAPVDAAIQTNQLKVAFFFLCHLTKSIGGILKFEKPQQVRLSGRNIVYAHR